MSRSEPAKDGVVVGLSDYEQRVLASWTDTHKKSALMLFILLALRRVRA